MSVFLFKVQRSVSSNQKPQSRRSTEQGEFVGGQEDDAGGCQFRSFSREGKMATQMGNPFEIVSHQYLGNWNTLPADHARVFHTLNWIIWFKFCCMLGWPPVLPHRENDYITLSENYIFWIQTCIFWHLLLSCCVKLKIENWKMESSKMVGLILGGGQD